MTVYVTSEQSFLEREINEEIKVVFQRRFGQDYTDFRFNQLTRLEQEWVIHNASVNVQKRRRNRL